jgi:hypothetical protein
MKRAKWAGAVAMSAIGGVAAAQTGAAHARVTGRKTAPDDLSSVEKIEEVDTGGDGILTAVEHAAGAEKMFHRIDSDKDGFVTLGELAAAHEKLLKKPTN